MGIQKNFVVRNGIEVNQNLIFADSDSGKVGIATTNVQYTLHVNGGIGASSINVSNAVITGITTAKDLIINGRITAGSSLGIAGQYLISTGTGVTWAALPSVRTVDTQIAAASQTIFTTQYLVGLLDVYINGVRLSSDEYIANNGTQVELDYACFGGETVEFISYSSVAPGAGFTGIQGLTILQDGTQVGASLQVSSINFVGAGVTASGLGFGVTVSVDKTQWETVASGIHTSSNVGIGTTDPQYKLHVISSGSTALYVDGDTRIVGILTVGSSSITLDGSTNIINVGTGVTLDGSTGSISASSLLLNGVSVAGAALSVSVRQGIGGENTSEVTDVKAIRFNSPTFSVTDLGNGEVFVNSESTFKTWYVDGEPTLVASGDDYVEFIAGPGIAITTRNTASGVGTGEVKSVTITSTGGGGGGESYWTSNASGIHTMSNVGIGTTNPHSTLEINGRIGFTTYITDYGVVNNILIGDEETGTSIQTQYASNNVFVGKSSGKCTTTGNENIFIGWSAGESNLNGSGNNFIGAGAGRYATGGCDNNFFGRGAGYCNAGSYNNFFGLSAGYNSYGSGNNFFGPSSGYVNTTGSNNNFFGVQAGASNIVGSCNNFFGFCAGLGNQSGSNNIYIGNLSGFSTNASYKIVLGSGEGYNYFDSPDTNKDTQLAIGVRTDANPANYWIVGNENFNVGIGTTNPQYKLHVSGDLNFSGTLYQNGIAFSGGGSGAFSYCCTSNITSTNLTSHLNITSASDNFFAGCGAGSSITTGNNNNFFGSYAGHYNTSGSYNNFLGRYAGHFNTYGYHNNFFGYDAGKCNLSGGYNNFFGYDSGRYNTIGSYNNFFGYRAGCCNYDGCYNNFFGYYTGMYTTSGCCNTFISHYSGENNTSGNGNTFIGPLSGNSNTIGNGNIFFGISSGSENQTGNYNVFLGSYSGISTSASNKIILGRGYSVSNLFDSPDTNKDTQLAIGVRTDSNPSKYWIVGNENFNVGIGTTAPTTKLQVEGVIGFGEGNNIKIGDSATGVNVTPGLNEYLYSVGDQNNFIGVGAGQSVTTGRGNNFIGAYAGYNSGIDNSCNNFIGYNVGSYANGSDNNFVGSSAGAYSNGYGSCNNLFGYQTGCCNIGSYNNFIGVSAGTYNSGCYNNFFGYSAGYCNTSGCNNNYIGNNAGHNGNLGSYNNFIGYRAGEEACCGNNNNYFGSYSGKWSRGSHNNFLGYHAGLSGSGSVGTGNYNNFLGHCSGYYNSTGSYNNFFGAGTGTCNTSGCSNNFIGEYSGWFNSTGSYNNFFGQQAGTNNTTGSNNNFFGNSSGTYNCTGQYNNFFGTYSGYSNEIGQCNTFIGLNAGRCNISGNNNTFIGSNSGRKATGSDNIYIGQNAGCNNTTGSANIIIGNNRLSSPILNGSNQLVIGAGSTNWIVGNSSYNIGIGTTNPSSKLTVAGDVNVSGIITATGGFVSIGNTTPIQISLVGNQLTFTAVGIGSTTLTLF